MPVDEDTIDQKPTTCVCTKEEKERDMGFCDDDVNMPRKHRAG